jgi:hypothetical protein
MNWNGLAVLLLLAALVGMGIFIYRRTEYVNRKNDK